MSFRLHTLLVKKLQEINPKLEHLDPNLNSKCFTMQEYSDL